MPSKQGSSPSLSLGAACCTVNADSRNGTLRQWQSCLQLQVWPTEKCPRLQALRTFMLMLCIDALCKSSEQASSLQKKQVGSLDSGWL